MAFVLSLTLRFGREPAAPERHEQEQPPVDVPQPMVTYAEPPAPPVPPLGYESRSSRAPVA